MPRRPAAAAEPAAPIRLLDRVVGLAVFTLILVVPLIWSVQSTSPFRAPKSVLAMVCWVVLAAVLLARALPATDWLDAWWLPWLALVLGGALSAPFSELPGRVLLATVALVPPALGWGAVRRLDRAARERAVTWVIAAGTLQAVLTLAFLTSELRPASFGAAEGGRELWIGTLGNPGDVAMFLVLPALLALDRAFVGARSRTGNGLAAAVMVVVIASSQSLSGTLALLVGVLVLAWQRAPRRRLLQGAVAGAVIAAVLIGATPLRGRVVDLAAQLRRGRWMWIGSGRLAGYQAALGMFADNPVVGAGLGMYAAESFRYQNEWTLANRGRELGLTTGFGQAHNDLLQHLAETGLIGLAALVAAVVVAARRRSDSSPPFAVAPLVVAAGALVLLQFPLHLAAIAAQWVVLWALASPPLPRPEKNPRGSILRASAATLVILLAVAGGWRTYRATVALLQSKVLITTLRAAPASRTRNELARHAMAELASRRTYLPFSWDLELTLGNLAMVAEDPTAALQHFRAALALGERPETRYNIGMALLAIGDRAEGLSELDKAVRLNPAIFRRITDPDVSLAVRERLDAAGYGRFQGWMYRGTPAERR